MTRSQWIFFTCLPLSTAKKNSIWVIVDRLTKHPILYQYEILEMRKDLFKLYLKEIVRLHGIITDIVPYRDQDFKSVFG